MEIIFLTSIMEMDIPISFKEILKNGQFIVLNAKH